MDVSPELERCPNMICAQWGLYQDPKERDRDSDESRPHQDSMGEYPKVMNTLYEHST